MTALARVFRAVEAVTRAVALVGVGFLFAATLLTVADVVLRAVAGIAILGTVDLMQLCVVTAAFAGIPWAFMAGAHVSVDLATDRLPPRGLALVRLVAALAGGVVMAAIGRFGWQTAARQIGYGDTSQTLGLPIAAYWTPLLAGSALAVVACATIAAVEAVAAATGRHPVAPRDRGLPAYE
ncbi:MAG: TRAP transporter small permease subunit [Deinococcus-Thermus bacterium]|jgi:TRAP-type C4-dicarboxylate transport system permease small subunit|nr:TRAP transporter small permease subunit [Deinococcota bacterium]